MKMPAFQFYPGDWRKDPGVQALDFFDRGVWFEMLCLMHESEERGVLLLNGRPMPEVALARMLGLDNQILTTTLTNLLTYGVASKRESDGAIYSRRMVKDEQICQVRREAGKKGGNPNLLNQTSKQKPTTRVNQIPTPSSSSSSSTSSSEEIDRKESELAAGLVDELTTAPEQQKPSSAEQVAPSPAAFSQPDEPLVAVDDSSLTNPQTFFSILKSEGYGHVDAEHYRSRILNESQGMTRTARGWRKRIVEWLDNDKRKSKLMLPAATIEAGHIGNSYNPPAAIPRRASTAPLGANNSTKDRWR